MTPPDTPNRRERSIIRTMTTINNQDDFLQALDNNPQWRDAVRARILGDELLQLPVEFHAFVQRVEEFIRQQVRTNEQQQLFNERAEARMYRMETDIAEIRSDVTEIRSDVTGIRAELRSQTGRIDNVLGYNYETKVERNLPSIAGQYLQLHNTAVLRGSRPDRNPELERLVEQAVGEDRIALGESAEIWLLDLIFTGRRRAGEDPVYVAAEISITAGDDDITRAGERAKLLTSATGWPVTAAVICANMDEERRAAAASGNVTVIPHPAN